ncbi:DNA topoisomerase, partial [Streptococcus anginosus]|uniref:DNA topoisomerase n=1 Tax=Streptococcus anginosus TaxID=1328 RepID=UPI0021F84D52
MVVDREEEIRNFVPEEYWSIEGVFQKGKETFKANASKFKGKKIDLKNEDDVKALMANISSDQFEVKNLTKKQRKRNPQKPF